MSCSASAVTPPTAAIFSPANALLSRPRSANFSRTARTALTEVNPTHSYRPVTIPSIALSIWAGVRGGSTLIVGTISPTAPYRSSSVIIEPACSLVRGTRTRQPNSGSDSNQLNASRPATPPPTTATRTSGTRPWWSSFDASPSAATVVRCSVVLPCATRATSVCGSRPAARISSSPVVTSAVVPQSR